MGSGLFYRISPFSLEVWQILFKIHTERSTTWSILMVQKSGDHHLKCKKKKTAVNNGIWDLPFPQLGRVLPGFLNKPSTVSTRLERSLGFHASQNPSSVGFGQPQTFNKYQTTRFSPWFRSESSKKIATHPRYRTPETGNPPIYANYERNPGEKNLLVKVARGVFQFGVLEQP